MPERDICVIVRPPVVESRILKIRSDQSTNFGPSSNLVFTLVAEFA